MCMLIDEYRNSGNSYILEEYVSNIDMAEQAA